MAGNTGVLDISAPAGFASCLWTKRSLLPCRASIGTGIMKKINHVSSSSSGSSKRVFPVLSALTSTAPAVSMRTAEKSIQLPIDYYQILGAESHYSADAMVRAYEARAGNPPTEGFSQEALKARQQILKVACDTLADRDLREEYDNGLKEDEAGTLIVDVPWSKIPGALCLLQEVGEAEVVLQVGEALLDENLKKPSRQDVVLVMALAYVELSREAMAEVPPAVVRSCEMLNAALRLLKEGGSSVGTALQEQIYETLEEITPRCVLDLLGLPLDEEHKAQRVEGLQEVRKILWTMDEGLMARGGFTREHFMKEALSRMTANEQVALFTETPSNIPAEKLEVYSAALAHVAEGFRTKKPRLIQEANTLFTQLQESLHRSTSHLITDEQRDVILGRALTALLLGEVENCRKFLGLNDSNSPFRCPAVVEFVISNSDENEDNDLSGMCKLLESWLMEEVFTNFRETTDIPMSLSEYYDDPEVLAYLEKLEKGSPSALEAPTDIARIGAALDSLRTTFEKVFSLRRSEEKGVIKEVPVIENMDDSTSLVSYGQPAADTTISKQSKHGFLPLKIACIGALFGGMVIASLQYPPLQKKALKYFRNVPVLAAISSALSLRRVGSNRTEQALPKEVSRMDVKLAEQLIRKWQSVKAQALGVNHVLTQLNEILDGQMLKIWTDRAVEVSKHGWYWEYKLLGLNIDSVTISEDGTRAIVEATLQEAARLYDSKNPQYNDSYTSSYTTRYDFHRGDTGWKITNGAVLRTL